MLAKTHSLADAYSKVLQQPTPPLCPFWPVLQQREIGFIPPYTPATQMLGEIFSNLSPQK